MNKRNKKKGFTLIELIVVMAIIAILVGIAVPQITKQINNSKIRSDVATAKTIAGALQQYMAEGNTITASGKQKIEENTVVSSDGKTKIDLKKYIDNATAILKPKANTSYDFYYEYDPSNNTLKIFAGPSANNAEELYPVLSDKYTVNIKQDNNTQNNNAQNNDK
ncbi:type II secretion system protein [Thermobrachium celere]|uniref:Type IV pilin PilA n=1 Tax=Thermobrachium celere DSM 8682 TaxID=941824 RepID=R7RQP8_9CLOT|nr:type II secretion system protein [Thermobrachium celere]CDF57613.1 hypothetical protein TCEL_01527 [Thermobrachium celere DSM 8682]